MTTRITTTRTDPELAALSLGLFAAWVANDVEELVTMRADSREVTSRLARVLPLPRELAEQGVSQGHIATGISIMGGIMAAASIDGLRSGGRGRLFQTTLLGFGVHGFGHLAQSAYLRRWTSGARTSPTVVIPAWLLISHRLRRRGVDPLRNVSWPMVATFPAFLAAVHAATWAIRRGAGVRRPLLEED